MTLGDKLAREGGRPSGFDYMRIILSVLVLFVHSFGHTLTFSVEHQLLFFAFPANIVPPTILPMFFALSGFLVAGSMYRCASLVKFLGLRVMRIYPALAMEILLTAFLLGPFVTSLSLAEYFTDQGFFRYLLNVTGHTTQYLPHTFTTNPVPDKANVQLWTVPYELYCYMVLSVLIFVGGKKHRIVFPIAFVLLAALLCYDAGEINFGRFIAGSGRARGPGLVLCFLAGVLFYVYRDKIPYSRGITIGLIAGIVVARLLGEVMEEDHGTWFRLGSLVSLVLSVCLTPYLGVMNPRRIVALRHADLSYGIFLYHGIVQQTLIYVWPSQMGWFTCFLTSLVVTTIIAHFSWTLVEKPVLLKKDILNQLEAKWMQIWDRNLRKA